MFYVGKIVVLYTASVAGVSTSDSFSFSVHLDNRSVMLTLRR